MSARRGHFDRRQRLACALLALCVVTSVGCNSVQRRMTIKSNPPGALVMVDGEEVGYTPASIDFTYYAEREITLIKDGYETLTTLQKFRAPPYQWFGPDFISDNFLPFTVTNRHDVTYRLKPRKSVPTDDLLNRAEHYRSDALFGK